MKRVMKINLCFFVLASMLFIPLVYAQSVELAQTCQHTFEGKFVDQGRSDAMILQFRAAEHEGDKEDCSNGLNLRRDPTQKWDLFYQAGNTEKRIISLAVDLNSSDYARFIELCTNPETGLDQLIFKTNMSGTDASEALFVFYDQQKQQFASVKIDAQFMDSSCSFKSAEERQQRLLDKHAKGDQLYDSLQPLAANKQAFSAKALPGFNLTKTKRLVKELNLSQPSFEAWAGASEVMGSSYEVELLAENSNWRIMSVYYDGELGSSWGVLLAENKSTGQWLSFYDVPQGTTKRPLYLPDDIQLHGDDLTISLCTDCTWWGKYAPFQVELKTFTFK